MKAIIKRIKAADLHRQTNTFNYQPSLNGKDCQGNGEHKDIECQCDECDYYLKCFPVNKTID